MTEKATMGVLIQMVQQNDDKHEKGHGRLRSDYRDLEKRVMALERAYTDTLLDFTKTKTAMEEKAKALEEKAKLPVDVTRLGMTLRLGLSLAGAVAVIVGGAYSSAAWVKSDVQGLRSDFVLQKEIERERHDAIVKSIDELRKRQELTEIEVRNRKG